MCHGRNIFCHQLQVSHSCIQKHHMNTGAELKRAHESCRCFKLEREIWLFLMKKSLELPRLNEYLNQHCNFAPHTELLPSSRFSFIIYLTARESGGLFKPVIKCTSGQWLNLRAHRPAFTSTDDIDSRSPLKNARLQAFANAATSLYSECSLNLKLYRKRVQCQSLTLTLTSIPAHSLRLMKVYLDWYASGQIPAWWSESGIFSMLHQTERKIRPFIRSDRTPWNWRKRDGFSLGQKMAGLTQCIECGISFVCWNNLAIAWCFALKPRKLQNTFIKFKSIDKLAASPPASDALRKYFLLRYYIQRFVITFSRRSIQILFSHFFLVGYRIMRSGTIFIIDGKPNGDCVSWSTSTALVDSTLLVCTISLLRCSFVLPTGASNRVNSLCGDRQASLSLSPSWWALT